VADREDVRHARAPLLVYRHDAPRVHLHAGGLEAERVPVRAAPHGDEHAVEGARLAGALALEADAKLLARALDRGDARPQEDRLVAVADARLERLDQVGVAAGD